MKCPLCNAPTEVKQTKTQNGVPFRYRNCFNDHTFQTKEVPITVPRPKRQRNQKLAVHQSRSETS